MTLKYSTYVMYETSPTHGYDTLSEVARAFIKDYDVPKADVIKTDDRVIIIGFNQHNQGFKTVTIFERTD